MPSNVDLPIAPDQWASPADRQHAARAAYRRSVADGRPLSGVQLGRMFGRKARWGTERIAEVRTDAISGSSSRPAGSASQLISNRRSRTATDRANGNGGNSSGHGNPHGTADIPRNGSEPNRQNGNAVDGPTMPIGSTTENHLPPLISSNGNGAHAHEPPHDRPPPGPANAADPSREHRSKFDTVITLVVAFVAFAASYRHMLDVAVMAGEPLWVARAFPITVDGLVLAALRRGPQGRGWLALGAAASVAANVLAQFPEVAADAGPVVSAWPPLAFYGTHRLISSHRPKEPIQ